jgi:RNA polymerase sigma factor (sigma-70 family)
MIRLMTMSNDNAFNEIFLSFRKKLARAVSHIVPPKEIEDIVQEAYVRVCQIENSASIRHPRSFLLTTARNLAFDHIKRYESCHSQSIERDGELDLGEANDLVDETYQQVAGREEFSNFCEAVRLLPVQCRKVFVLKKVYGYSQREIAKELEISESTVEKHIALGLKRCTYFMMKHSLQESPLGGETDYPAAKVVSLGDRS